MESSDRQITRSPNHQMRRRSRRGGFTLIEAALTTVIVGTGVLAMVAAQQAYHMQNNWAQRSGTAMLLANEIRELTLTMPMYDPIDGPTNFGSKGGNVSAFRCVADFAGLPGGGGQGQGTIFAPPINALRQAQPEYERWRQVVHVHNVPDTWLSIHPDSAPSLGSTNLMRVTVDVQYREHGSDTFESVRKLVWVVTE